MTASSTEMAVETKFIASTRPNLEWDGPYHSRFGRVDAMNFVSTAISVLDAVIVTYVLLFFGINVAFVVMSMRRIGGELAGEQVRPAIDRKDDRFLPAVTLLLPAYNEEV